MPVIDPHALIIDRVEAIKHYHRQSGVPRAEIDVSGGLDSAVLVALLSRALGPENVIAVYTGIHSSEESRVRAIEAAEAADVDLLDLDLTNDAENITDQLLSAFDAAGIDIGPITERMETDPTILGSFRSCLRAPIGRFANRLAGNGIRHGTGNECEDRFLRFYQKGGDGEVDTNPIAMLAKGEVFQMARALEVPRSILEALPSPDLWGDGDEHNDEDELARLSGVEWTYSRVDPDTGEYTRIGTIEAMSRFLDQPIYGQSRKTWNEVLFLDGWDIAAFQEGGLPELNGAGGTLTKAMEPFGLTMEHILSAMKWERGSRHKMNPNCPSLGSRQELLDVDIITNELPKV